MESVGEQQIERMALAAGSAIASPIEGFSTSYLVGLEIAQKNMSKLFDFARSNLASLFKYSEIAAKARSPSEFGAATGHFCQTQAETFFRQMNEMVATTQNAAIAEMDRRSELR
jgi:hypothetical protein